MFNRDRDYHMLRALEQDAPRKERFRLAAIYWQGKASALYELAARFRATGDTELAIYCQDTAAGFAVTARRLLGLLLTEG